MKLWILTFYQKENSQSTLNRKGWISMSKPYLASQQLSQYVFLIRYFPQEHQGYVRNKDYIVQSQKSILILTFKVLTLSVEFNSF